MAEKIVLIGNPIAGGGAALKIKRACELLSAKGYDVELMLTGRKGDAENFARAVTTQPELPAVRFVLAAGGDGTYNEVANGLIHSPIPMAILPLGTTSVLARELHVPLAMEKAVDVALSGTVQTVHLGKITFIKDLEAFGPVIPPNLPLEKGGIRASRYFLLMAGIGFDAETTLHVDERVKKFLGKGAYLWSGVKTLLRYNPEPIKVWGQVYTLDIHGMNVKSIDLTPITGYAAIIGKASCYGGAFKATPDARLTDPYFYVFITHQKSRRALLRYVMGVLGGKNTTLRDTGYFKAAEILVEGHAPVQIDGDYAGTTPVKIEIERDALKIIMP